MSLRSSLLLSLLLSAACTAGGMDSSESGPGGKTDKASERCASAALDDAGVCRASDGTFAQASCCELQDDFEAFSCSFDEPSFGIDNSFDLGDTVVESQTVTIDDYAELSPTRKSQIRAAASHLSFLSGGESDAELFSVGVTDDEEFILNDVRVGEDSPFNGNWIKFFAGDTEVGVVFDVGTLTIVAEIGDGDIMSCTSAEPAAATFSCSFEQPIFALDTSADLRDFVVDSDTIDSADFDSQSALRQQQLYAAAVHLTFLVGSEPVSALFDEGISDDDDYIYSAVAVDSATPFNGEWVKFFAGDTEVGVVFDAGTTNIVSEVSDGDLMACTQN